MGQPVVSKILKFEWYTFSTTFFPKNFMKESWHQKIGFGKGRQDIRRNFKMPLCIILSKYLCFHTFVFKIFLISLVQNELSL